MSATTPQAPKPDWAKVYGRDPELLLKDGAPIPADAYFEYVNGRLGSPAKKEDFRRFEGSNGCVAWAWSKDGAPVKVSEDRLGQPIVRASLIISWNPTIRSYEGSYYDFLAYEAEKKVTAAPPGQTSPSA